MKHAVIDESFKVINIIKWDGESLWSPPIGTIAIQSDMQKSVIPMILC